MDQKNTISTLNSLIETLKDGQYGFKHASENVEDSDLKTLFSSYSTQRSKFAGELQQELVHLGEPKPEEDASVTGALHRGWINLKSALSGKSRHAVLAECERGEDYAVSAYKKATESGELPAPIMAIVNKQYQEVLSAHNNVRSLRDASAKS
jgi:uncharacterized protein (TIGR02284 family)